MSEESQVGESTEEVNPEAQSGTESELTREDLLKVVADLRKENAGSRVRNKTEREEITRKLNEHDEWKKSQLSEVDRLKAEKDDAVKLATDLLREKRQATAAKKAGLDPDLADRISGDSDEEMLADAKKLAAKLPTKGTAPDANSMFAGQRGAAVGSGKDANEADWFRKMFSDH